MSDDEFMMNDAVDDEDYDFDYGSDDGDDGDPGLENSYYNAKGKKEDSPEQAVKELQEVVRKEAEEGKGEWGFKALKQLTKISFQILKNYDAALKYYTELLTYTKSAVTRNVAEKSINGILDYVSNEKGLVTHQMRSWYEVTEKALNEAKNERLSVKISLKLAKLWLDRREYPQLVTLIKELKTLCAPTAAELASSAGVDNTKQTQLYEVMSLEILMYTDTKQNKKLKEVYNQSKGMKDAIVHPRIMGIMKECGGKMHMNEKEWSEAQEDFFEAFKSYDEAGSSQRTQVLKYLVLAHMLMDSEIDPFDSQETKPYKNDPEIQAMTNLVQAYQHRDVHEAEKILASNRETIQGDPFIRSFIDDVLRSLRTQWILELIKTYERIEISYLANQLRVEKEEVEDILVGLILDGKVKGKIDQVTQRLELEKSKMQDTRRYQALDRWTGQVENLHQSMFTKATNGLTTGSGGGGGMTFALDEPMSVFG
ncbi:PCI-domain-containing protein [Atractiella rhizophila]|nr:PCI-domain-containing protein [Atractiella rhizophila]